MRHLAFWKSTCPSWAAPGNRSCLQP